VGHRSLKAALALAWGAPGAKEKALRLVLEAVGRWKRWLAPHQSLLAPTSPLKDVMGTIVQMVEQDTEPAPTGSPGGRRLRKQGAPDRRSAIADQERRHGRKRRSQMVNGFKEPFVLALDSPVPREVVVCPAHEPACAAVEVGAEALERGQGWRPLDIPGGHGQPAEGPMGGAGGTALPAPGRKAGRWSASPPARWTSRTARSPVPTARPCR
jgi:hypothetical protein